MTKMPSLSILLLGTSVVLPLAAVACGPTHTGLCERAAECGQGRDPEIEACVVDMDAREEQAEIFSCTEEWELYLDCLDDQGTCVNESLGGCDARRDALNECSGSRRSGNAKIELRGMVD